MWTVELFTSRAKRDFKTAMQSRYAQKVKSLFCKLEIDPYAPPLEALRGDLAGAYSKRINIQHRVVYTVDEAARVVRIVSCWQHY